MIYLSMRPGDIRQFANGPLAASFVQAHGLTPDYRWRYSLVPLHGEALTTTMNNCDCNEILMRIASAHLTASHKETK